MATNNETTMITAEAPKEPTPATLQSATSTEKTEASSANAPVGVIGDVKTGEKITADDSRVQEELQNFPGLSTEAAIGNVVMRDQKALEQPQKTVPTPAVVTSDGAKDQTRDNLSELSDLEAGLQEEPEQLASVQEIDAEVAQYKAGYDEYIKGLDADSAAQIKSIEEQYVRMRQQMEVTNKAIQGAVNTAGFRSGRSRYAPEIQQGIIGAEVRAGQQRISDLVQEEKTLIMQAQTAARDKKWGAFNEMMNVVRTARAEKNEAIQQHRDAIFKIAEEERERAEFAFDIAMKQQEFDLKVKEAGMDVAIQMAKQNESQLAIDENGNVYVSDTPTSQRMREEGKLMLDIQQFDFAQSKFEKEYVLDQERIELAKGGLVLDTQKYMLDVEQFGHQKAYQNAQLDLSRQKAALDRFNNGFTTTYDELGILAGSSVIEQAISQNIKFAFNEGEEGGQCGDFAHKIVDFPSVGDYYKDKQASVRKHGMQRQDWLASGVAVGDVVISSGADVSKSGQETTWGHVAVVNSVNADGTITLTESNMRGDLKVTNTRTIRADHPAIYGAIRGGIKDEYMAGAVELAQNTAVERVINQISKEDRSDLLAIQNKYNSSAVVKDYRAMQQAYNGVASAYGQQDDIALVFNYMKTLDPGSTVREGEFDMAQSAGSWLQRGYAAFKSAFSDKKLTVAQRDRMMESVHSTYKQAESTYLNERQQFIDTTGLIMQGHDLNQYLPDYTQGAAGGSSDPMDKYTTSDDSYDDDIYNSSY